MKHSTELERAWERNEKGERKSERGAGLESQPQGSIALEWCNHSGPVMCFVTMATSPGVAAEWFLWQQEAPTALLSTSCLYSERSLGTAVAMRRITLAVAYRQTHKYSKTLSILLRENRKAETQVNEITHLDTHILSFSKDNDNGFQQHSAWAEMSWQWNWCTLPFLRFNFE